VFTKNKRTRASSKNPSSVPSLTPAMQELRNGWKRGQPLPAALRVHALDLVDSGVSPGQVARLVGVSPESIRLWRTQPMKENRNAEAQRTLRRNSLCPLCLCVSISGKAIHDHKRTDIEFSVLCVSKKKETQRRREHREAGKTRKPKKAWPRRLLELVRGHWKIKSLHWVRAMIYDEDRSQVRKGQAPQLMATFRNVAISLLRFAGASSIASSVRHRARNLDTVLSLIGILPT